MMRNNGYAPDEAVRLSVRWVSGVTQNCQILRKILKNSRDSD